MTKITSLDIMLYYPNLIGFARFMFSIVAVKYAFDAAQGKWLVFVVCYSIS